MQYFSSDYGRASTGKRLPKLDQSCFNDNVHIYQTTCDPLASDILVRANKVNKVALHGDAGKLQVIPCTIAISSISHILGAGMGNT